MKKYLSIALISALILAAPGLYPYQAFANAIGAASKGATVVPGGIMAAGGAAAPLSAKNIGLGVTALPLLTGSLPTLSWPNLVNTHVVVEAAVTSFPVRRTSVSPQAVSAKRPENRNRPRSTLGRVQVTVKELMKDRTRAAVPLGRLFDLGRLANRNSIDDPAVRGRAVSHRNDLLRPGTVLQAKKTNVPEDASVSAFGLRAAAGAAASRYRTWLGWPQVVWEGTKNAAVSTFRFWARFRRIFHRGGPPSNEWRAYHLNYVRDFEPRIQSDGETSVLEWGNIRERVQRDAGEHGLTQEYLDNLTVSVIVNGVAEFQGLPWEQTRLIVSESPERPIDYYIVYMEGNKIVHASSSLKREGTNHQNIDEQAFNARYFGVLFGFDFGGTLEQIGVSATLSRNAVRLGYKKVVWVLSPEADPTVRTFIKEAPKGIEVRLEMDSSGMPKTAKMINVLTGAQLETDPDNFFFKVDAAFNGNSFFWDDMLVALATVPYHPWLAESTIRFWLRVQKIHGGVIPREIRKENFLSVWFPELSLIGRPPRPNLMYTNPYLMNWTMDLLYRFDPSDKNLKLMKEVSDSIAQYARWMETHRGVRDESGEIIGFNGSALGTGLDNSRGGVGNWKSPLEELGYRTGFIDLISQHIAMLKDRAKWNRLFAEKAATTLERIRYIQEADTSADQAEKYTKILNEQYYSDELGFYFDIVQTPDGGWIQNQNYHSIAGFWPLYAGAASPAQVQKIIDEQLGKDGFGGDFPLPANARRSILPDAPTDYKPRDLFRDEDGYWDKWGHWPSMAMVVIEGLRRSGRSDIAHTLAVAFVSKMAEVSEFTVEEVYGERKETLPDGRETYRARVLQHSNRKQKPDFAGWGKGPPIYHGLIDILGLQPDHHQVLEWTIAHQLKPGEKMSVYHLAYLGGTVEELTLLRRSDGFFQIITQSDIPLRLKLRTLLDDEGRLQSVPQQVTEVVTEGTGRSITPPFSLTPPARN